MSKLSFKETDVLQVKGFISAYTHTDELEFVQLGEGNQGYYKTPKNVQSEMHVKNLIVNRASQFMAKRMKPGTSWGNGIQYLEVGTGVGTGTTQVPQREDINQSTLRVPLTRKEITSWTYLDANDQPTAVETNVLALTTTFNEQDAIGAIVEMGLFGGDATAQTGTGYMFNYKAFPVWNKADGMRLTIVWKITF